MKKLTILLLFLILSIYLMGHWVQLNEEQEELYICEQQTRGAAEIEFNLDGYEIEQKEYDGVSYTVISHPESGSLLEIGKPDLPVFSKALIIPDQGVSHLEIISYDEEIINNVRVYPQEALQDENQEAQDNFRIDENFYNGAGKFPTEIAWVGDPAIMRDLRILPVTFSPFQYDAATRTLRVLNNIRVRVITEGEGGLNAKTSSRKRSRAFEKMYQSNTLNYDAMGFRDDYQIPTILFICNDNDTVIENLEYLLEWKREKGFNVELATTSETGTSAQSIKDYIQDAYDNWDDPPEYVNIIGDGTGSFPIATWFHTAGGYTGEGDHPYSQLEGDDILGDVIMGRMTYGTISVLQTVISKVLIYEKTPYMGNTAWYNHALLVGDSNNSGYSTVGFAKGVKELMLDFEGNFWSDDNFTEVYSGSYAGQMNNAVNQGISFFVYRGFGGTSGWYSGTTNNGYMMPYLVMPTCNANDWCNGTGNVEGFYLMGTTSMPNGGIGAMGTSSSGTHTPFNNALAIGVWGGLFRDRIFSMGGTVLQGKYYLWLTFPQNPNDYVTAFSHWNTLMGDGSLDLWTRVPQTMSAVYNEVIPTGANNYQVTVIDSIGNAAEGAWVTLHSEDPEYTRTGFCDYTGSVILNVAGIEEGEYTLTITKHDHIPVIETITVEEVEQFVDTDEWEINDETGNNNGVVNPGESVSLTVALKNNGSSVVNGVSAELECDNDQVTVTEAEVEYGNIASGETATGGDGFGLEFADNILGGVDVRIELTITDADNNEWHSWINIPVEGASLYASDYVISGDGVIDPGDTENLYFVLDNIGDLPAEDVQGVLLCNNHRITIVDDIGTYGTIPEGGSGTNSSNRFTVTASTAILPGTYIPFMIHLTNNEGYDNTVTINVPIGEPGESDPYGPDEYGYWCYDDGDTSYNSCPEYDWVEIDPNYGGDGESVDWIYINGAHMGLGEGTGAYGNVDLPEEFNLVYYGEEYDEISICTNGWVAPGYHESANFMNYQIPGPQGPSPMIAVFWDDLSVEYGDVLYYFDEDLHYFVVEWSRISNGDTGSSETFEVILYDPVYYPTTTGDCEIKMQYQVVNNNNTGQYPSNHGQYATVGLENEDSLIGLQYTYNNSYPDACRSLEDEMALLFTPTPIPPDGPFLTLSNFYALSGDDYFIEAGETALLSIELENLGAETAHNIEVEISSSDPYIEVVNANADLDELGPGEFSLLENAFSINISENVPDYYMFYLEVIISSDENSWNWMMPYTAYWTNTFAVDQDSVYYELEPLQTGSHQFTLTNTGDLPVEFYVRTDETTTPGRNITGSYITMDTDTFTPGEETTWTFTVFNASEDNEWVSDVWLDFPLGVNVVDAGDAIGGSSGNMVWDETTGWGQRVNWHGLTANGWGVLHDGEMASWEVDVVLSTEFAGDMTLGWEVGGDGYGEEPHSVTGELVLLYPLRWMNLDTSSGYLGAGESVDITINFDAGDIEEGIHTGDIVITCDSWDTKIINVVLDVSAIGESDDLLPDAVELIGNYPNPFNPETEIFFNIPTSGEVALKIYNLKGQHVKTLTDGLFNSGTHSIIWDGKDKYDKPVSSGVYLYRLETEGKTISSKMALLK